MFYVQEQNSHSVDYATSIFKAPKSLTHGDEREQRWQTFQMKGDFQQLGVSGRVRRVAVATPLQEIKRNWNMRPSSC